MGNAAQPWRKRRTPWWRTPKGRLAIVLALLAISSAAYVAADNRPRLPAVHSYGASSSEVAARKVGCDIKGNINERGEHIYHVPGQEYYLATRINTARGERWFCSEWEAWWAGWRKAKV
ncbi:sunset domain-containing protein [Mesorhizobium carmichaelinearum]|uniref:sunset domain-containing protein n=1 Tax=Mesorhizobium carmichaelinearum TaxID=1208188 RepID=UPI00117EE3D0|nr:hypothetical protein [Mesorhizobium carmichaelinearum]